MKTQTYKFLFVVGSLLLVASLALAACGGAAQTPAVQPTAPPQPTTPPEPALEGDAVRGGLLYDKWWTVDLEVGGHATGAGEEELEASSPEGD
ncbi:MAG TPA: hypothetical protein VI451_20600, partial [Anaerolineales bacterium]|nr:hypothetical protein [Anaerolineales bacterium]